MSINQFVKCNVDAELEVDFILTRRHIYEYFNILDVLSHGFTSEISSITNKLFFFRGAAQAN